MPTLVYRRQDGILRVVHIIPQAGPDIMSSDTVSPWVPLGLDHNSRTVIVA